jgi:hypothetical protein
MNLLRQKVSFLIKLFFKKPSERSGRLWTDGHSVLYECTALTTPFPDITAIIGQ